MATARSLITPEEFIGVASTVQRNNPGMALDTAEEITAEALKFVAACAASPTSGLKPSRTVDEGWHALILHTVVYARLCKRLGLFVHHVPEPPDVTRHDPGALARTMDAITAAGYEVNASLWKPPTDRSIPVAADCEHSEPAPAGCGFDCSNTGPNVA
ncbi:glycine-rich domain-containing protein [Kitasatospora sp. NPDC101157]|uniref:glycine-rich domain-containing protein n=1 Tax=Kitasatospora sp. NPDC101157 TaxID=3364098 RepID=UPI00380DB111